MFNTLKRLLVGRPLATSEQEHQRISKTIALAVFSSDAISSTAYATQQILVRDRVRRLEPRARSLEARADRARGRRAADPRHDVVPPDDLRLPERRRLLHREPREPRREPVARRGRVADGRLHPHRRGVGVGRRRGHHLDPAVRRAREASRRGVSRDHPAHHARQPARDQGVGPDLRVPHLRVHLHSHRARVLRADANGVPLVRRHPHDPVRPGKGDARA